jgi:hypothetical protein
LVSLESKATSVVDRGIRVIDQPAHR